MLMALTYRRRFENFAPGMTSRIGRNIVEGDGNSGVDCFSMSDFICALSTVFTFSREKQDGKLRWRGISVYCRPMELPLESKCDMFPTIGRA